MGERLKAGVRGWEAEGMSSGGRCRKVREIEASADMFEIRNVGMYKERNWETGKVNAMVECGS